MSQFSPDGQEIAFDAFADRALMRMPVGGGPASEDQTDADTPTGHSLGTRMAWCSSARDENGIWLGSVNAAEAKRIAAVNEGEEAHGPWLLPDNDHYLFTLAKGRAGTPGSRGDFCPIPQHRSAYAPLGINGSDARYLPTGHLIYAVSGSLWAVPFDPDTRTVQGKAVAVLEGVSRATGSFTGRREFQHFGQRHARLCAGPSATPLMMDIAVVEDPTGKTKPRKLNAEPDRYESLRVSPDGLTVAAGVEADKENATIYTIATSGGTSRQRRTPPDSDSRYPAWTHDSRRFAFQSNREGDLGIWWQLADGSGQATRLTTATVGEEHIPEAWLADGTLLYSVTIKGTRHCGR